MWRSIGDLRSWGRRGRRKVLLCRSRCMRGSCGPARSVSCSRRGCGGSRAPHTAPGGRWRVTVRSSGQWSAVRVSGLEGSRTRNGQQSHRGARAAAGAGCRCTNIVAVYPHARRTSLRTRGAPTTRRAGADRALPPAGHPPLRRAGRGTRDGPTPKQSTAGAGAAPRRFHTNYVCMRGSRPAPAPPGGTHAPPLGSPVPRAETSATSAERRRTRPTRGIRERYF